MIISGTLVFIIKEKYFMIDMEVRKREGSKTVPITFHMATVTFF